MDIYNLINSKAISEHCRKIQHQFNTEELAVLIYRNKRMSVDEKISAYQELITDYPDMEVIERINCKHYDSVKDMIQGEIQRVRNLRQEMQQADENMIYTYEICYRNSYLHRFEESNNLYKTYDDVCMALYQELKEDTDNEILKIQLIKRTLDRNGRRIIEKYNIENKQLKLINIYSTDEYLDLDGICLNIPTPFKKGDLLTAPSRTIFNAEVDVEGGKTVFVLEWLCNWNEKFQKILDKGNHDSSDMNGCGYYINKYGDVYYDHIFDYDRFEYFDGELKGNARILKAMSSLMQNKISFNLFFDSCKYIFADKACQEAFDYGYTDEGLKLAGLNDEDIKRVKG